MFDFNQFYRTFEDKYRGSTEMITDRLRFYLPFILPLKEIHSHNFAVDLGCGRGEWVHILAENGFSPTGVDINDLMIDNDNHEGVVYRNSDALEFLQTLPNESQSLVSAFHLIEHVPFSYLTDLLNQAQRVLLPGGLLVLETPNPENAKVATESFYLDPTHLRPIPMQFISFLVDYIGFKRQIIVRLQEPASLLGGRITVGDLFVNVSPDYGIIAQKKGSKKILEKFDAPFGQSYGVSFANLSKALDEQTLADFKKIEGVLNEEILKFNTAISDRLSALDDKFTEDISSLTEKTIKQMKGSSAEIKGFITSQFGAIFQEFQNQIPEIIEQYTDISQKKALDEKTIEQQIQQIQMLTERFNNLYSKNNLDEKTINDQIGLIQTLQNQVGELKNQNHHLESQNQDLIKDKQAVVDELISVYSSKSFRLMRPLRRIGRFLRKYFRKSHKRITNSNKSPIETEILLEIDQMADHQDKPDLNILFNKLTQNPYAIDSAVELKNTIEQIRTDSLRIKNSFAETRETN